MRWRKRHGDRGQDDELPCQAILGHFQWLIGAEDAGSPQLHDASTRKPVLAGASRAEVKSRFRFPALRRIRSILTSTRTD